MKSMFDYTRYQRSSQEWVAVFPLSRKKRHLFWTPANKNFENRHLQIWTQFPSQKKFSQSTISLLFQRCAEHILMI